MHHLTIYNYYVTLRCIIMNYVKEFFHSLFDIIFDIILFIYLLILQ